jgi:hypothetical protein
MPGRGVIEKPGACQKVIAPVLALHDKLDGLDAVPRERRLDEGAADATPAMRRRDEEVREPQHATPRRS